MIGGKRRDETNLSQFSPVVYRDQPRWRPNPRPPASFSYPSFSLSFFSAPIPEGKKVKQHVIKTDTLFEYYFDLE